MKLEKFYDFLKMSFEKKPQNWLGVTSPGWCRVSSWSCGYIWVTMATAFLSPVLTTTEKVTKETRMCTLTHPPTHTYTGHTHKETYTHTQTLTHINLVKFTLTHTLTHTQYTHSRSHIIFFSRSYTHTHTPKYTQTYKKWKIIFEWWRQ